MLKFYNIIIFIELKPIMNFDFPFGFKSNKPFDIYNPLFKYVKAYKGQAAFGEIKETIKKI